MYQLHLTYCVPFVSIGKCENNFLFTQIKQMRKNIIEFWIFQQYIMEVKFKSKIQLEFADNQTRLTHLVQELLCPMKSEAQE